MRGTSVIVKRRAASIPDKNLKSVPDSCCHPPHSPGCGNGIRELSSAAAHQRIYVQGCLQVRFRSDPKISLKLTISFESRDLFQSNPGKAVGSISSHFNFPERTLGFNATQWNRKVSHGPKRLDSVLSNFVGFGGLIFNPLVTCLTDICHRGNPVGPYQCGPRGSWGRKCGSNPKRKASGETGNRKPRRFAGVPTSIF